MSKIVLLTLLLGILAFAPWAMGAEKFGVVDLQRALNLSQAGREAKEAFSKKVESAQRIVDAKEQELRRLQAELEKQMALLSDDARSKRLKELQDKQRDFERFVKDSREELAMEERRLTNKILETLEKVVQKIGKDEGYTFIFERNQSGIIYVKDAIDLTDKVIKLYDTQRGK